ncbi:ABC transporter substrate-binding protein [Roseomonas sp. NAR14]|uniref:ABC transporter substrate-binding protein n=1 Tax=Roseomonas acroporae TaxID=2937791 RepID=A0A9X1Y4C7_9PROT|nr:ABC transporter substrate-binding protein [Roseomonas acroporae]MCK8783979.1 ABC transporter substrate-binding protein [Roseomonas acroporae]
MLSRPTLLAALALPALFLALPAIDPATGHVGARRAFAQAAVDIGRASGFIQSTGQELAAAINTPGSTAARRDRVAAIVRRTVDVPGIARFILGRWWRVATPAEQQEYLRLFEETLVRNVSARFGEYQGVSFTLGRSQQRTESDALVNTVIQRPGQPAFSLDWRVAEVNGQLKVVDVIAEGTSLRLTQRSEYSSVIQRNNGSIAALLAAMRNQVSQLSSRESR